MSDVSTIIWLFPIVFMFHDFEEIIFIKPWFIKNRVHIMKRFPKVSGKLLPYTDSPTTSSLSLGISGMFVLICVVTITAHFSGWYYIWFGVFSVFTAHLLIHCIPSLVLKNYVPAVITSVICLPFCCWMIVSFLRLYNMEPKQTALFIVVGFALLAITRLIMQFVMQNFDKWLIRYKNKRDL